MSGIDARALRETLRLALAADDDVRAAWEGGSKAFGSDDAWSDIDAVAVVRPAAIDAAFGRVEAALAALAPIDRRVDMPASAGYAQKFFHLAGTSEFHVVDLVLLPAGAPLLFREVELHGRGQTWFDRDGLLVEARLDAEADLAAARARVPALTAQFAMFQHLARKETRRGRALDALSFYQAHTVRPLVEALRLLHCPQRRGFGMRYLGRDLPPDTVATVERLAFVRDLADLAEKQAACEAWFSACAERLQALGPGAGLPRHE